MKNYKQKDFQIFKKIIKMMVVRRHKTEKGLSKVESLIQSMNRRKYKSLKSSEAIRRTRPLALK